MSGAGVDLGIEGIVDARHIGAGGAANVYRARQPRLQRTVAVKIIQAVGDPATARRFEREAAALGSLSSHPGIVTVYDAGTNGFCQPYLIMEYCELGSLQDRVDANGPMTPAAACAIVAEVAGSLNAAHAQNILHRDLKPGNLLIGPQGTHLVADFGIAALANATGRLSTAISFSPGFVPPETLSGAPPTDRSDVYSLGATLFALVIGRAPFTDGAGGEPPNLLAMVARINSEDVEEPREFGIPNDCANLIQRCMARAPMDRPLMAEVQSLAAAASQVPSGVAVVERDAPATVVAPSMPVGQPNESLPDPPPTRQASPTPATIAAAQEPPWTKVAPALGEGRAGTAAPTPPSASDLGAEPRPRSLAVVLGALAFIGGVLVVMSLALSFEVDGPATASRANAPLTAAIVALAGSTALAAGITKTLSLRPWMMLVAAASAVGGVVMVLKVPNASDTTAAGRQLLLGGTWAVAFLTLCALIAHLVAAARSR